MRQRARVALGLSACFLPFFLPVPLSVAQTGFPADDFSITLKREVCFGTCPDYKVTILGDGSVQYEGREYVRVSGIRRKTVPVSSVEKLVQRLREEDFFHWEEKKEVCIDFPEVHITVTLKGQQKSVLEGCNSPGKVLALAAEIDELSGARQWVGKVRSHGSFRPVR